MTTVVGEMWRANLARHDLLAFLDYVQLPDESIEGGEALQYQKWPHIINLHEACEATEPAGTLPVGKARQRGATSYFEARFLHKAQFIPSTFFPVMSQGEDEAKEFIKETRFIWEHLPPFLQAPLKKGEDNTETLGFVGGGRIQAFPSTTKAGQSFTATEALMDEADFHEYFSDAYHTILPILRRTGGKLFMVSTANPLVVDSAFRQVYQKAPNRLFIGYFDLPGITQADYDHEKALAQDTARFEKHNARTEEEFLAPPRAMAYFDPDVLQWMLSYQAQEPMKVEGYLSTWKPPAVGRHYVIGGDTAWGKTGSYTAAAVSEWETAEQVAEFWGRPAPNEAAYELFQLHKTYNHAFIGVERAGEGQERDGDAVVVVEKLEALMRECSCAQGKRIPMLYYHDHEAIEPKKPGFQTDGTSRPPLLGEFREVIRERQATIRSRGGIGEMMTFIQNEKGRPEASKGAFDDRVMSYAIMWQMRKFAKFKVATQSSGRGSYVGASAF